MLPRRLGGYRRAWLDQLCSAGELVWVGAGSGGGRGGRVALYFREDAPFLGPPPGAGEGGPSGRQVDAIRERLSSGAAFWSDLITDLELPPVELKDALWELVWAGELTNDAFAPLRARRLSVAPRAADDATAAPLRLAAHGNAGAGAGALEPDDAAVRAATDRKGKGRRHGPS